MEIILNDSTIRNALVDSLKKKQPKAIIQELRVHNGNAIADVVALHKEAHCYEIKGASDKIDRIQTQGLYYNSAFRKITVVTTLNHLNKAMDLAPAHWGIIVAKVFKSKVILQQIRPSKTNPHFDKEKATHTLWKSEMLDILQEQKYKNRSREFLAHLISQLKKDHEISVDICDRLFNRHTNNSHQATPSRAANTTWEITEGLITELGVQLAPSERAF
jgi:hypothetical protein